MAAIAAMNAASKWKKITRKSFKQILAFSVWHRAVQPKKKDFPATEIALRFMT